MKEHGHVKSELVFDKKEIEKRQEKDKKNAEKRQKQEKKKSDESGKDVENESSNHLHNKIPEKNVPKTRQVQKDSGVVSSENVTHIKSKHVTDEDLMRRASCFKGVLFSNNIDENLKVRRSLLQVKSDTSITLYEPSMIEKTYVKEIEGSEKRNIFLKSLKSCGDISTKCDDLVFVPDAGHDPKSPKSTDKHGKGHCQVFSYSKFTLHCISLKCFRSSNKSLSFSQDALVDLLKIQKLLGAQDILKAQTASKTFFQTFGTHICFGDVHFGGIGVVETRYECSNCVDKQKIKTMVDRVHAEHVEAIDGASGASNLERDKGKMDESEKRNIKVECTKIGGPHGVDGFQEWKKGLVNDNSTWCVVNAGMLRENAPMGVWDLLSIIPEGFDDVERLSSFLKNEALGQKLSPHEELHLRIDTFYKRFQSTKEARGHVDLILEFNDMLKESKFPKNVLNEEIKQQSLKISEILQHAATLRCNEREHTRRVKALTDILDMTKGVAFDSKQIVIHCITTNASIKDTIPVMDISHDLQCWFENLDRYCRQNKGLDERSFSIALAKSVLSTRENLLQSKRQEDFILMMALLIPYEYNVHTNTFNTVLKAQAVGNLIKEGKDIMKKRDVQADPIRRYVCVFNYMLQNCLGREHVWQDNLNLFKDLSIPKVILAVVTDNTDLHFTKMQLDKLFKHDSSTTHAVSWSFFESQHLICRIDGETEKQDDASLQYENDEDLGRIFDIFSLKEYFPAKITLQIVQKKSIGIKSNPSEAKEIPWSILTDALSSKNEFRENILETFKSKGKQNSNASKPRQPMDLRNIRVKRGISNEDKNDIKNVAPADLLLAIFLCCTMELRKVLAEKMHQCKFAIPLVYITNTQVNISLWPLREIQVQTDMGSAASQSLPIVSFVRIGDVRFPISKSKQINALLRGHNEEYNTFSHKDCPSGSIKRTIANGMVEVSWFVPPPLQDVVENDINKTIAATKDECSELSKSPVTICNLRGDASSHTLQLKYLSHISSVLVVFVTADSLTDRRYLEIFQEVYKGQHDTIVLTNVKTTDDESLVGLEKHTTLHKLEERDQDSRNKSVFLTIYNEDDESLENLSKMKSKLTDALSSLLGKSTKTWSFEKIPEILRHSVNVDEDNPKCALGKKLAHEVLDSMHRSEFKKQSIVPLQGSGLWQRISELEKKRHSSHFENVNDGEPFLEEYNQLRQSQVHKCNEMSETVAVFVKTLSLYGSDAATTYFFLSSLSQGINMISMKEMRKKRSEIRKLDDVKKNEKHGSKIDNSESELTAVSFGLEHLFREIGQIYEAFCSCQDELKLGISFSTQYIISKLPVVAARTLMHGHTFEIMDGDASNIQQKWVSAVLKELHKQVGESKITTISVLGIQSSGKSTLLNTMFGLKFSVSAGRCTRGIYAQLLPVDVHTSKLSCDYLLVLDTEGLRSTEEGFIKYNHDNELSTFVVGLADIILINVKGETIAELENVLQIVAHAFVRFRQKKTDLKLPQTAMMIHQNVPAHDAIQKLAEGNKQLVSRLDRITTEVAIQERVTHISSFKDVINFNHITDVVYIPDLWLGRPPMSPISPHYSDAVVKLKEKIIRILQPKKTSMTMNYFQQHIDHLWGRIISESLVFSFQNCLEVKAYRLLDAKCQNEVNNLEAEVSKWYNDHVRQKLSACKGEFEKTETSLIHEMTNKTQSKASECKQEIETFFENSDFKEQMLNWHSYKLERFNVSKDKIIMDYATKIETEKHRIVSDIKGEGLYEEKKKEITLYAKEIAQKLQGRRLSDRDINKQFDIMWTDCIRIIEEEEKGKHQSNVQDLMIGKMQSVIDEIYRGENFLQEIRTFHEDQCNVSKLKGSWDKPMKGDVHESAKSAMGKVFGGVVNFFQRKGMGEKKPNPKHNIDLLLQRLDNHFAELSKRDIAPSKPEFRTIVLMTKGMFDDTASQGETLGYVYTKNFESKTSRHIFRFALNKFIELNEVYQERHSLIIKLLSFKPTARKLFQDVIEAKSEEIIAASIISQDLESIIQDRIDSQIPHELLVHVMGSCSNKFELMIKILDELGVKIEENKTNAFSDLTHYISSPSNFARQWLTKFAVMDYFGERGDYEKSGFQTFTSRTLTTTIKNINICIDVVSESQLGFTQSHQVPSTMTLKEWSNKFREQLKDKKLKISEHTFGSAVQGSGITISEDFTKNLKEKVDDLFEKLSEKYENSGIADITWMDESPFEKLFKTVWGCTEQCPLCGEPCHKADASHFSESANDCHSCIQHKPLGIKGISWTESGKLVVESCNFNIQSPSTLNCGRWCKCESPDCNIRHPYREYKQHMPEWDIEPSSTMTNCKFWMWIMAEYKDEFAAYYGVNEPDIPQSWTQIDAENAKLNLRQSYGVTD